jgi:hypothetical protein
MSIGLGYVPAGTVVPVPRKSYFTVYEYVPSNAGSPVIKAISEPQSRASLSV